MPTTRTICELLKNSQTELDSYGVKDLWLFGSVARGEESARDIDMLVSFSEPPTLVRFMGLKFFLEDRLDAPVDLHTRSACPDRFLKRIEKELQHVA